MPYQPSSAQVHVNRPLTNISIAYIQSANNFVASRVAPTVSVPRASDRYFAYQRDDFFRDSMQKRAYGAESAGSGYNIDNTPTYSCTLWALHKDVPWAIRDNADSPINMDRDATLYLTQQALIRKEKIFSAFMTTGVWTATGTDSAPSTKWDAASGSSPIQDMRAGITAVHRSTGYRPNTIVIGQGVWDVLVDHADLIDRVKYGTQTQVSTFDTSELAAILKVPNVLVMGGVEATNQEGDTAAYDFIAQTDSGVLIAYVNPNPGIMMPSALYTFAWTGHLGANAEGGAVASFPMRELKSDRIEIEMAIDVKQIAADMGYFIPDVLG
jgi:hypothetical protein